MVYAGFWRRTSALLIDAVLITGVFFSLFFVALKAKWAMYFLLAPIYSLTGGYEIYCHARWGMTLGKKLVGIKVVSLTGGPISIRQAFLRSFFSIIYAIVSIVIGYVILYGMRNDEGLTYLRYMKNLHLAVPSWVQFSEQIWIWSEALTLLFNKQRRAIHDFIAGTIVIRPGLVITDVKPNKGCLTNIIIGGAFCLGFFIVCMIGVSLFFRSERGFSFLSTKSEVSADIMPEVRIERPHDWMMVTDEHQIINLTNRNGGAVLLYTVLRKDLPAFEGAFVEDNKTLAQKIVEVGQQHVKMASRRNRAIMKANYYMTDGAWSFETEKILNRTWGTCSLENERLGHRILFTIHEGNVILVEYFHEVPRSKEEQETIENIIGSIQFPSELAKQRK